MKNIVFTILTIFWAFAVTFSHAAVQLSDVETAIISDNYKQAKVLAADLLSQSIDQETRLEAQYYLGLSTIRLDDYLGAREIFQKLVEKVQPGPLRDKSYLGLFDSYYMNEDYEEAIVIINKLLKVSPKSELLSLIYLKAARSNLKLAQWQNASGYLKKITAQFPNSFEYHIAAQLLEEKHYFAVQVGAFIDRDHAVKVLNELKHKGEYGYIVETKDRHNRKFYRVRVGQLSSLSDAYRLKNKLSQYGYPAKIYP